MSKLVRSFCMVFCGKGSVHLKLLCIGLVLMAGRAHGQEGRKVPISFLPPPLENATYSLGIFEAKSGKLVRRLQEIATESAFTVGLNGLVTDWDGRDDAGKAVPPGRYAAHGFAVGAFKVEGVGISGNDWASDDESLRIKRCLAINRLPADDALAILALMADDSIQVMCFERGDGKLRWKGKPLLENARLLDLTGPHAPHLSANDEFLAASAGNSGATYYATDGRSFQGFFSQFMEPSGPSSAGKDRTTWKIEDGVLGQYALHGEKLRQLAGKAGEPVPVAVAASKSEDRLYLLEEKEGWQRVRGLSWVETKEEDGKPVSTWQTFFERNIRDTDPVAGAKTPATVVETSLVENPLAPGKTQKIKFSAGYDDKGSYLLSTDKLRLRQISQRANLNAARLTRGKGGNGLAFFQSDGAAWDEFSIDGAKNMMEFDAGEFEMTADGEKKQTAKPAEPPDL